MRSTILRAVLGLCLITVAACGNSANRTEARPDLQPSDDITERLTPNMTTTADGLLAIGNEAGARAVLGDADYATLVERVNDLNVKILTGGAPRLTSVWDLASTDDASSTAPHAGKVTPQGFGCQGCVNHVKCTKCVLWVLCFGYAQC